MIGTIAAHQLRLWRRQRVAGATIAVLVALTVLAGVLGWASHRTIVGVYDESVKLLAARGLPAPANPFVRKPSLSMLSNMVVYVTLIGALVALFVGHLSVADDEADGIGRLLFSRGIRRSHYTAGKITGAAVLLGAALAACTFVSAVALTAVNRSVPPVGDLVRLVGFYVLAWLYLTVFSVVGSVGVLLAGRRSLGLLVAMGVWLAVTFAVPQFTSGLRPTQSLNPIVDPVSTSQTFFRVTRIARPYSIGEQFKEAAGRILRTAPDETTLHTFGRIAPILGAALLAAAVMFRAVARHEVSRGDPDD